MCAIDQRFSSFLLTQQESLLLGKPNLDSHLARSHSWAVSQPSSQTSLYRASGPLRIAHRQAAGSPFNIAPRQLCGVVSKHVQGFVKFLLQAGDCLKELDMGCKILESPIRHARDDPIVARSPIAQKV